MHVDVIKWKYFFTCYWPFVRGIQRSPVNSPHKRPVTRSVDVFSDLRLNKRLRKQSWDWWFETPSRSLWRHCHGIIKYVFIWSDVSCVGENIHYLTTWLVIKSPRIWVWWMVLVLRNMFIRADHTTTYGGAPGKWLYRYVKANTDGVWGCNVIVIAFYVA